MPAFLCSPGLFGIYHDDTFLKMQQDLAKDWQDSHLVRRVLRLKVQRSQFRFCALFIPLVEPNSQS
jgi:hypothetical protein